MNSDVHFITKYFPYRVNGIQNPLFQSSKASKLLLDLKEPNNLNHQNSINYFTRGLLNKFTELKVDKSVEYLATAIPSSTIGNEKSGLLSILKNLKQQGYQVHVIPDLLVRNSSVPPLHKGGNRDISIHLATISVTAKHIKKGDRVILLDDIGSTGNSMRACSQLLYLNGALEVLQIAIGKTSYE